VLQVLAEDSFDKAPEPAVQPVSSRGDLLVSMQNPGYRRELCHLAFCDAPMLPVLLSLCDDCPPGPSPQSQSGAQVRSSRPTGWQPLATILHRDIGADKLQVTDPDDLKP
jgi:hypothetical protein